MWGYEQFHKELILFTILVDALALERGSTLMESAGNTKRHTSTDQRMRKTH